MKKQDSISEALRHAIESSELSRYQICKRTGVSESTLSRFMSGAASLKLTTVDQLAEVLGIELRVSGRS
jgi:transcriptional regulator with XRE-family HTH domain